MNSINKQIHTNLLDTADPVPRVPPNTKSYHKKKKANVEHIHKEWLYSSFFPVLTNEIN